MVCPPTFCFLLRRLGKWEMYEPGAVWFVKLSQSYLHLAFCRFIYLLNSASQLTLLASASPPHLNPSDRSRRCSTVSLCNASRPSRKPPVVSSCPRLRSRSWTRPRSSLLDPEAWIRMEREWLVVSRPETGFWFLRYVALLPFRSAGGSWREHGNGGWDGLRANGE